ncbi:hypothetical protein B4144_2504 [Bacillus atrophaeus]|nr:hypothetical protein B4144_2504 [Bacillus atrophaeus]
MVEKHIKAYKDYVKGMKYKGLAEKYGCQWRTKEKSKRCDSWILL